MFDSGLLALAIDIDEEVPILPTTLSVPDEAVESLLAINPKSVNIDEAKAILKHRDWMLANGINLGRSKLGDFTYLPDRLLHQASTGIKIYCSRVKSAHPLILCEEKATKEVERNVMKGIEPKLDHKKVKTIAFKAKKAKLVEFILIYRVNKIFMATRKDQFAQIPKENIFLGDLIVHTASNFKWFNNRPELKKELEEFIETETAHINSDIARAQYYYRSLAITHALKGLCDDEVEVERRLNYQQYELWTATNHSVAEMRFSDLSDLSSQRSGDNTWQLLALDYGLNRKFDAPVCKDMEHDSPQLPPLSWQSSNTSKKDQFVLSDVKQSPSKEVQSEHFPLQKNLKAKTDLYRKLYHGVKSLGKEIEAQTTIKVDQEISKQREETLKRLEERKKKLEEEKKRIALEDQMIVEETAKLDDVLKERRDQELKRYVVPASKRYTFPYQSIEQMETELAPRHKRVKVVEEAEIEFQKLATTKKEVETQLNALTSKVHDIEKEDTSDEAIKQLTAIKTLVTCGCCGDWEHKQIVVFESGCCHQICTECLGELKDIGPQSKLKCRICAESNTKTKALIRTPARMIEIDYNDKTDESKIKVTEF